MPTPLHILLHAPDAEGLQRARMNLVNALRADPSCQVRIIANAAAVAAALEGKQLVKEIYVKGRLVNLAAKG